MLAAFGLVLAAAPADAAIRATLLATGLSSPVFATAPPNDPRLFVVERSGTISILSGGRILPAPFLDLSAQVRTDGERGLLGLAFPSDYASSGAFYVYYTDLAGRSVISRFHRGKVPDEADAAEETVLVLDQPAANHNGGTIAFGPDGFLYFAPGDGGGSNDPAERSQDPTDLLGKMLRLDVGPVFQPGSTPVPGTGYAIPAGNPLAGVAGVRGEIWAFGLRNPYRFSFDLVTGDLWIADVGQSQREEIDFEPAADAGGRNWGWDVMEGTACNPTDPAPAPPCRDASLSPPVYEYAHTAGRCAIIGGFLSRGRLDDWRGRYVFGDYCTGEVWTYDPVFGTLRSWTAQLDQAAERPGELLGFGQDAVGRIYLTLASGELYRVDPRTECNDGIDNDGDGGIDFGGDPGCATIVYATESPACSDGIDNDGDGRVDLADPQCYGNPAAPSERFAIPLCGLGPEVAFALAALGWLRARRCGPRGRRSVEQHLR